MGCESWQHSLDIFREDIEFEIDVIAGLERFEIGVAFGVGDDPARETVGEKFGDGETDAIDGDRSFAGDVMAEVARQLDLKPVILTDRFESKNARGAIDVALDKMAAQSPVRREGSLEVDRTSTAQMAQICAVERFLQQIEGQMLAAMSGYGKAATVDSNAIAAANVWRDARGVDLELRASLRGAYPKNKTDILNESGKHIFVDESRGGDQETPPPKISQIFFLHPTTTVRPSNRSALFISLTNRWFVASIVL